MHFRDQTKTIITPLLSHNKNNHNNSTITWIGPPKNQTKLNIDAYFIIGSNIVGFAPIIRNFTRKLVRTKVLSNWDRDVEQAEVLVKMEVVFHAKQLQLDQFTIEGDKKIMTEAMCGSLGCLRWEDQHIIQ